MKLLFNQYKILLLINIKYYLIANKKINITFIIFIIFI